jgi:hypothetical protein
MLKITVTASEVSSHGNWDAFCEITGLDHYAMAEGLDSATEYNLTFDEAEKCGMISRYARPGYLD